MIQHKLDPRIPKSMMANYDSLHVCSKTLEFPDRLTRALQASNINTLGQLRNMKRSELHSIPNVGITSISIIKEKLIELYETDDPVLASINVRLQRIESMLEKLL